MIILVKVSSLFCVDRSRGLRPHKMTCRLKTADGPIYAYLIHRRCWQIAAAGLKNWEIT